MKSVRIKKILTDYLPLSVCLLTQRPSLIARFGERGYEFVTTMTFSFTGNMT